MAVLERPRHRRARRLPRLSRRAVLTGRDGQAPPPSVSGHLMRVSFDLFQPAHPSGRRRRRPCIRIGARRAPAGNRARERRCQIRAKPAARGSAAALGEVRGVTRRSDAGTSASRGTSAATDWRSSEMLTISRYFPFSRSTTPR